MNKISSNKIKLFKDRYPSSLSLTYSYLTSPIPFFLFIPFSVFFSDSIFIFFLLHLCSHHSLYLSSSFPLSIFLSLYLSLSLSLSLTLLNSIYLSPSLSHSLSLTLSISLSFSLSFSLTHAQPTSHKRRLQEYK